jgi:hypothetical protein
MRALWLPIFSMRSYETGKYAILKDGNFQLALARALASDFDYVALGVPLNSSDYAEAAAFVHARTDRIKIRPFEYGENAVETREIFWAANDVDKIHGFDLLITDITGYYGKLPVIYNFNITKLPELDRPYIDKFFEKDLKSIEQSLFTTVINPRQREYILEVRPDLIDRVFFDLKCAHSLLLPKSKPTPPACDPMLIFWPFRLSDKAYKWTEFLEAFERQGLADKGWFVVITDPNESSGDALPDYVQRIKPTKAEYYGHLDSVPMIVMLDDIDTVLHPGTVEFLYYGCPMVTFTSNLIDNPVAIDNLDQLETALETAWYNMLDHTPFVYEPAETDQYYNQEFVRVCKN